MPRFFLSKEQLTDMTSVTLSGDDARHISFSLRMAVGDRLILSDGEGQEYEARLTSFTEDSVTAEILSSRKSLAEPPVQIRLYQAYPKGDKLDTIVQKAVELGVSSVIPFVSERCIKRPPKEKAEKNTERLSRIAAEAAKQCGRASLPSVSAPMDFLSAVEDAARHGPVIFCYEAEENMSLKAVLSSLPSDIKTISFMIGSEGGFSPSEAEAARMRGAISVSLGHRILRCETAPAFVLAACVYAFEL